MTSAPPKKKSFFKELPFLIVTAIVLSLLIRAFLVQSFYIPSGSMEKTLHGCPTCTNDRVLVEKVTYRFTDPSRGDVVVFHGTGNWPREDLIKRVIGTPGDVVQCCDAQNRVIVNGQPLNETYLYQDDHRSFGPITVPDGMIWVMGDHRSESSDSRDNGLVPISSVVGEARVIIWPLNRINWL
ncbi:hypothetical protein GCM10027589_10420 [Actinocorallia lasiicapitis]